MICECLNGFFIDLFLPRYTIVRNLHYLFYRIDQNFSILPFEFGSFGLDVPSIDASNGFLRLMVPCLTHVRQHRPHSDTILHHFLHHCWCSGASMSR